MRALFLRLALLSVNHAPCRLPHGAMKRTEPRTGSWFVVRGSRTARPSIRPVLERALVRVPRSLVREPPARRSSVPRSPGPALEPVDPWRFRPGARFQDAIAKRHIAHGSLKLGGLVRACCPRSARRGNVLARTVRD